MKLNHLVINKSPFPRVVSLWYDSKSINVEGKEIMKRVEGA